jgi:hypothetical protein
MNYSGEAKGNLLIITMMVAFYFLMIAGLIFIAGYIVLWLLQHFHVIGGCVC